MTPTHLFKFRKTMNASNIATTLFTLLEQADWTLGGKRHSQGDKQSPEFLKALEVRNLLIAKLLRLICDFVPHIYHLNNRIIVSIG